MSDLIYRQAALEAIRNCTDIFVTNLPPMIDKVDAQEALLEVPSAQSVRLTDDDFETIRIHLNAWKERLCNQRRWKEAEEYQRIIDRFVAFASAEPERKKGKWNFIGDNMFECTYCGIVYTTQQLNGLRNYDVDPYAPKFCPNCGADMRGDIDG